MLVVLPRSTTIFFLIKRKWIFVKGSYISSYENYISQTILPIAVANDTVLANEMKAKAIGLLRKLLKSKWIRTGMPRFLCGLLPPSCGQLQGPSWNLVPSFHPCKRTKNKSWHLAIPRKASAWHTLGKFSLLFCRITPDGISSASTAVPICRKLPSPVVPAFFLQAQTVIAAVVLYALVKGSSSALETGRPRRRRIEAETQPRARAVRCPPASARTQVTPLALGRSPKAPGAPRGARAGAPRLCWPRSSSVA